MDRSNGRRWVWWGSVVAALLFFTWAFYQRNDPDVALWASLYGLAGLFCVLYLIDRLSGTIAGVYAAAMAVLALYLATGTVGQQPLFEEQAREMWGGFVTAVWMAVLYYSAPGEDADRREK